MLSQLMQYRDIASHVFFAFPDSQGLFFFLNSV